MKKKKPAAQKVFDMSHFKAWPVLKAAILLCLSSVVESVLPISEESDPQSFIPEGLGRHVLFQVASAEGDTLTLAVYLAMPFTGAFPAAAEVLESLHIALARLNGIRDITHTGVSHLGEVHGKDVFRSEFEIKADG